MHEATNIHEALKPGSDQIRLDLSHAYEVSNAISGSPIQTKHCSFIDRHFPHFALELGALGTMCTISLRLRSHPLKSDLARGLSVVPLSSLGLGLSVRIKSSVHTTNGYLLQPDDLVVSARLGVESPIV